MEKKKEAQKQLAPVPLVGTESAQYKALKTRIRPSHSNGIGKILAENLKVLPSKEEKKVSKNVSNGPKINFLTKFLV